MIERETSSIATELDAIETKISPILSEHVPSYEMNLSCANDDTTATCTSTTMSKTRSPRGSPQQQQDGEEPVHRYINLSDFENGECLLGEMDSVSDLFSSDISSIGKCQSFENVDVKDDAEDEMEVVIKRQDWHSVDASNARQQLNDRDVDESYVISMQPDDLSEVSGLSCIAHEEDDDHQLCTLDSIIIDSFEATVDEGHDQVATESLATYERNGQKSHLYSFPDDMCCLFNEPSQDINIPASVDDEEDAPCFILGVKSRNEEDECGCVIC